MQALSLLPQSSTDCRWEEEGVFIFPIYNSFSSSQTLTPLTAQITLTHIDHSHHWNFVVLLSEQGSKQNLKDQFILTSPLVICAEMKNISKQEHPVLQYKDKTIFWGPCMPNL